MGPNRFVSIVTYGWILTRNKKIIKILKDNPLLSEEDFANKIKIIFLELFDKNLFFKNNELEMAKK